MCVCVCVCVFGFVCVCFCVCVCVCVCEGRYFVICVVEREGDCREFQLGYKREGVCEGRH